MIVRVLEVGRVGVEDESGRSVDGVEGRLGEDMVRVGASDGMVKVPLGMVKVGLGGGKGEKRVGVDGGAAGVGLVETSLMSASLMDVSSGESTVMTFSALLSIRIMSVSNIGDGELELPEFSNN